ncbi:hypothetical protein [Actinomyces minihominis]|uniref:hypothetical protein n=1 Tax=Actinomyces minihominis TaxID=2002838 RepID=UPI00101AE911|nr:hypothetical protein [Actinomyces minihominis]
MSTTISLPSLRRRAHRLGLLVRKSRVRDSHRWEFERMWLVGQRSGFMVACDQWGFALDELAETIDRLESEAA